MQIRYTREFKKQYAKASQNIKQAFKSRRNLLLENPQSPVLNSHSLKGSLKNYKSINITGDWRALYSQPSKDIIVFEVLGTHSQLYK